MALPTPVAAPVLSTPDTHIFEDPTPAIDTSSLPRLNDEQVAITYEIERTISEIRQQRWKRIALQFPDTMLVDAPRVFEQLRRGLLNRNVGKKEAQKGAQPESAQAVDMLAQEFEGTHINEGINQEEEKLFILADTSYGACCVDEVAAEHVDADVVVHYGRSCLSPPSRLPVVYVFTQRSLEFDPLVVAFKEVYPDKEQKVVLMADIPYSHHIPKLHHRLSNEGYTNIFATEMIHDPASLLPNRTVPPAASSDKDALRDWHLFHVSDPPRSLLLTLASRVSSVQIYPTDTPSPTPVPASTSLALRRRYALLASLSTAAVFGILINTLSVKNYMHMLSHVQQQISAAGKKYYTFVVGKVNAAKIANFSEIEGWVVIGCWESSLIESKEFWRPIITPFELEIALQGEEERVWTGEWRADFQSLLERKKAGGAKTKIEVGGEESVADEAKGAQEGDYDSEEESAPPEFDLRTGRYISHSRPMRSSTAANDATAIRNGEAASSSTALAKRANTDLAHIGGVLSPGAEFLREKRTWQGLGSDFHAYEDGESTDGRGAKMEEGRSGIARGYVVGDEDRVH